MIIFNFIAVGELLVAALVGAAIAGILTLFGFDFTLPFLVSTMAVAAPIDILWRLANAFGDDEDANPANLILPWGGGHLFFIPMFLFGPLFGVAAYMWG